MLIKVTAHPNADENKIKKKADDAFEVWTKMPAKEGWANRHVRTLLAEHFGVKEGAVRLVRGGKQPNKIFEVRRANRIMNKEL